MEGAKETKFGTTVA